MRRAFVAVLAGSLASCVHAPAVTPPGSTLLTADGIALEFELQVPKPQSVFVAAEYAEKDGRPDLRIWIEIVARAVVHNKGPSVPVRLRIIHSPSRSRDRIRVRRGPLISN
jgi:hypothetical protein